MSAASPSDRPVFAITDQGAFPLGRFASLDALAGIVHGVTTREGPVFGEDGTDPRRAAGAETVAARLGAAAAAWADQVHGGDVLVATRGGLAGPADALITATPGLAVLGRSADCPLVLLAGRRRHGGWAVGFAHASWRSTIACISAATIAELVRAFDVEPGTVTAAVGPCAGPCCYEVGAEVREQALARLGTDAASFFTARGDRWHLDLVSANVAQLAAAGVPAAHVTGSGICTICQGERFWSWRREREAAGRFAAAIAIVP